MELIILSLVGSLGAVLLHLLDFMSQRPGHASCPVASARTPRQGDVRPWKASLPAEAGLAANLPQSRPSTSSRRSRPGRELEVFNSRRTSNTPVDPL